MKKILMNAAIATGLALFAGNAFADDVNAFTSSIGFETNPLGPLNLSGNDGRQGDDNTYWNTSGDAESTFVTNYAGTAVTPPTSRPDLFAETSNGNFLKIDSPNGIERYMQLGGAAQSLDSDVFVDMNVQFTVSDTVLDLGTNTDNDKLAIWLYAPDTDGAKTNLVITAGVLSESLEPTVTNFVVDDEDLAVEPDTWYRLTVKTTLGSDSVPRFKVYVNTNLVSATATLSSNGEIEATSEVDTFASLVQYDKVGAQTLSSVTFQGVGALDDLAFTTNKPGFFPAEVKPFAIGTTGCDTFADAVEEAGGSGVITMQANYDASNETEGTLTVDSEITLDIGAFTLSGEYPITVAGGNLTLLGSGTVSATENEILIDGSGSVTLGDSDGVPTLASIIVDAETYSIKRYGAPEANAIEVVDGESGDAITGTWVAEAGETGYYVFTPGGEEPPEPSEGYDSGDGTTKFTIDSKIEEALEAKLQPTGKTLASTVSETSSMTYAQAYALGLWDAEADDVKDLEATIAIGADGKVTVSLANEPADGYVVTCKVYEKASLTATEWTLKDTYPYGSAKPITPASATAGFYKVEVTISNDLGD